VKRDNLERSPKIYLSEIIEFIDKIEKYTKGMSYDDFSKESRTVDAVDANLRNVGEAVRVLSKHRRVKELFYRFHIPYIDLSDMRTDLTHEYFSMNPKSIWKTTSTLIALKPQFKKVLEELS
jgi:uncharacterized protein with HEPN domain